MISTVRHLCFSAPLSRCLRDHACQLLVVAVICTLGIVDSQLFAQDKDSQETALRDLNSHFPFHPPQDLEAWQARAGQLRKQVEVSLGLYPKLELDPVEPAIYGKLERDGYTIEKVTFESLPGFYVTGNLYRPQKLPANAKIPAVLCPHGHWQDARFYEADPGAVRKMIATGAERFVSAGRNHIQARCVQLARMGCVVFHWDMIGYCDSKQVSYQRAHRFAKQPRESEVADDGWLLFSPLAESHCQSILGLQSLATQRAVDMLLGLPEVDSQRIAITGASGGGTQSFIGAAIDPRIQVAFPAVMVSTGMQGGCTCENASLLRTGTGNVEMAALIAPRPLGLTAADDWTRTMPEDGFPELRKIYQLMGADKNVALFPAIHFGHNYNHVSRTSMYGWLSNHFKLGFELPVLERDFELTGPEALTVWDDKHPQPPGGEEFERRLMKLWAEIVDGELKGRLHGDLQQLAELGEILETGWQVALGLTTGALESALAETTEAGHLRFSSPSDGRWSITPADSKTTEGVVIRLGEGPNWFFSAPSVDQSLVPNPRLAAAYTYGYNLPLFSQRARRLGLTISHLAAQKPDSRLSISGSGSHAALAAAGVFCAQQAAGLAPSTEVEIQLVPSGFRFQQAETIQSPEFVPGSARFWGLPGLVATLTQARVTIDSNEADRFTRLARLYQRRQIELGVAEKSESQTQETHAGKE